MASGFRDSAPDQVLQIVIDKEGLLNLKTPEGSAQMALRDGDMQKITRQVGRKALEVSADPFEDEPFNEGRRLAVERMLLERMEQMPPEQFQDLLRPCFKEDEWILILLGAALGFLAGLGQLYFVFG